VRQPPAETADGPQGRVAGRKALRPVPSPRGSARGAAERLAATQSLLDATLESSTDGILVVDLAGTVVGRNTAFDRMWRMPQQLRGSDDDAALLAHARSELVDPDSFLARVGEVYAHPAITTRDELVLRDGRVFERYSAPQRTEGRVAGRVWRFRDVTAERRLRADLERQAWTDPLTGLANRTRFMAALQAALDEPRPDAGSAPAVCLLDLDGFKFVNDALGHRAGDRVLQAVAERLLALVPPGATVARLGGDEFGIVLPADVAGVADALCTEAVEAVSRPVTVVGGPARVGASAGWTHGCTEAGGDVERLLHQADLAMYRAKKTGRGRVVAFTDDLRREDPQALRVEVEDLLADPDGLVVVFQPICDLRSGRVVGYEALSRFPGREHRPPQEWFALAREVGCGDALEARAVRQALQVHLDDGVYLALNLSPRALLAEEVRAVLERDLSGVVVEVTEESDLATVELVAATDWLRRRGARIAMDDTGEGFAGLRRLVQLHPDVVKLDRALVTDVHRHPDKAALVEALVAFCRRTGADLCAEGVETADELWALQDLQVAHCQGWMAGRPQPAPAAALPAFVAACRGVQSAPGDLGPTLRLLQDAATTYEVGHALEEAVVALDVHGVAWSEVRDDLLVSLHAIDDMPSGTYRISDYPATRDALASGRTCVVDVRDPDADQQEVRLLHENGYTTALLVPVPDRDGRSSSLIELYSKNPRTWDDAGLALVHELVAAVSAATGRAVTPAGP
jgi:diguanylate cyclase (GGDEF)-like protein